ncbi:MAG: DNA mismatch repair endonuclease MutL, partial [Chlamydiales bacterium]|nr:DNA mismatch repair endonuclease MutL [Chlamydiales bacterium]
MASKIRILDEKTINQIAAGEVIENPASVVKELVDNAVDAKASKIVVEAVNSGRQLLRIQDNGCGMGHDDALLCIERHATSKIRGLDDLWALETMGFRGEALSSVASISEFRLLTAPNNDSNEQIEGSLVEVHGGKVVAYEKVKCLPGTSIEIKSLFYNVPARKKFLKSPAKDASSIVKIMLQIALAHPQVAFELILNHNREFSWEASSLDDRIRAALGNEFFSELIAVNFEKDDLRIHGYIANPNFSRPTRSHQHLFVNSRPVTSLGISGAVKEAYGSSLDPTRHPAFVLYIDVATASLDVNVHPQKKEVRFALEDELKQLVIQAVSSALFSRHVPLAACSIKTPPVSYGAPSYTENSFSYREKPENH